MSEDQTDLRAYLESFDPEPVERTLDEATFQAYLDRLLSIKISGAALRFPLHEPMTIADLGWTRENAAAVRGVFSAFAVDWDAPIMDEYDRLPPERDEGDQP